MRKPFKISLSIFAQFLSSCKDPYTIETIDFDQVLRNQIIEFKNLKKMVPLSYHMYKAAYANCPTFSSNVKPDF